MLNKDAGKKFQKGFTLIEVMAAVAVFAISAAGLYSINQQTVLTADHLERKTFAHWVAVNHFNKLSIEATPPSTGSSDGKEKMADIDWKITTHVSDTAVSSVKRVVVAVSDNSGKQLAQINGFIGEKKPTGILGSP